MKRIKVFVEEHEFQLQREIDSWLDSMGETIDIIDTKLSASGDGLTSEIIVVITYLIKVKD